MQWWSKGGEFEGKGKQTDEIRMLRGCGALPIEDLEGKAVLIGFKSPFHEENPNC